MSAKTIRDIGVVLRTLKLGEADRIVTILTKDHGKIKCVAKGARKSGSKYSARLQVGSVIDFQWIDSNRDLLRLTQVESVSSNRYLREDLDLLNATAKMLDTVDGICHDHGVHKELAEMTINALKTMNETKKVSVCAVFLLKIWRLEGLTPQYESCLGCDCQTGLNHFSELQSGFYCDDCAPISSIETISHTRESILAIYEGKSTAVIDNMPANVASELENIAISLIENHTGRATRALSVI